MRLRLPGCLILQLLLLLCVSCSSDPTPILNENNALTVSAPRAIVEAGIPLDEIDVRVLIDGDEVDMQRVGNSDQWTGSDTVAQGESFRVQVIWSIRNIELARLNRGFTDIQTNTVVSFSEEEYTLVDSDSDGATNIEEIAASSDETDANSTPDTVADGDPAAPVVGPVNPDSIDVNGDGIIGTEDDINGDGFVDQADVDAFAASEGDVGAVPGPDPAPDDEPTFDDGDDDPTPNDPLPEDCSAVDCASANAPWSDNATISRTSNFISTYAMGIQRIIYCLNYGGSGVSIDDFADGIYGPITAAAVEQYQQDQEGLLVDGIVGPATWESLQAEIVNIDGSNDGVFAFYQIPSVREGCAGLIQFAQRINEPNDWRITSAPGLPVLIPFSALASDLP